MGLLVVVVLLLVIMPALLYLLGWGAKRFTEKAPSWVGFAVEAKKPGSDADGKTPQKSAGA
jgi:hypothetical protein